MLISTIGRCSGGERLDVDRYAVWQRALHRLCSDWDAGARPTAAELREYLRAAPDEHRAELLQDLIASHLRFTWQCGLGERLESYVREYGAEFGCLRTLDSLPSDLVEDEFLARFDQTHGDFPTLDEYEQRFATRPDVIQLLRERTYNGQEFVRLRIRGRGAMSEVFEAFDRRCQRFVAIKSPRRCRVTFHENVNRIAAEARITERLKHPSIANVHEHWLRSVNAPIYVMKIVNGTNLGEQIWDYHQPSHQRTWAERQAAIRTLMNCIVTICDVMAYAHANGVLHCDLKPGNIIVDSTGRAVIIDWAFAQRLTELKSGGSCDIVGTPQYMAPDQVNGNVNLQTDVFGLGAILYETLTGQPPRHWPIGSTPVDWRQQVVECRISAPSRLKPKMPRDLEAICMKAMAKNPSDRFQSAAELAESVRSSHFMQSARVEAQSLLTRVFTWLRRPSK